MKYHAARMLSLLMLVLVALAATGWAAARRCRWFWGESRRILKGLIRSIIRIVQPN